MVAQPDNAIQPRRKGPGRPTKAEKEMSQRLYEVGVSGTKNFGGIISDEYLSDLSMSKAPQVYDQMRRTDATVRALLAAYMMPLRASKWFVQPYDDSPESLKMADFLHDNLWGFGNQTFDDYIRQALNFLTFGYSVFEKVFDYITEGPFAGKLGWHHFAYRYPNTIVRWNMNRVTNPTGASFHKLVSVTQSAPPNYVYKDMMADTLVIFSLDKEGDNWTGISLLRAVYPHWKIKQILYRLQGIGMERMAIGVPSAKFLTSTSNETIQTIQNMLMNLRADDSAYVMFDGNVVDISYLDGKFDSASIEHAIEHHDGQIMKSGLAQFVNLGTRSTGTTGSYSLSQDQSQMFLDALAGEANYFASDFHNQATDQLIRWNFGENTPRQQMPRLAHGDIGERAALRLAQSVNAFAQYGFLVPDTRTENTIREFLDLPEVDLDEREAMATAALNQAVFPSGTVADPQSGAQPPGSRATPQPQPPNKAGSGAGISGGAGAQKGKGGRLQKNVGGNPMAPKARSGLSAKERDKLYTTFMSELQSLRTDALTHTPERPSTRAMRLATPYVIRGHEANS